MYKRELHLCKLRYVRDILNRARNLYNSKSKFNYKQRFGNTQETKNQR